MHQLWILGLTQSDIRANNLKLINIRYFGLEVAVLQGGDNHEMEDLYKPHISEMRHSIVQHHLPTRDVQAIFLYRVPDHIRAPLGLQVL